MIEATLNTSLGFLIAVAIGTVVYPHYGIDNSLSTNFEITAIFTVASLVRSYLLRRIFNFRALVERLSKEPS